jgi:hypothetical protein
MFLNILLCARYLDYNADLISLGVMMTWSIMRQTMREWTMPDDIKIVWDIKKSEQVAHAMNKFNQYLSDGWLAYHDESGERIQIFTFNPEYDRIVLLPPIGGG